MTDSTEQIHQGTKTLQELADEIEHERETRGHSPLDVTIAPEDEEPAR